LIKEGEKKMKKLIITLIVALFAISSLNITYGNTESVNTDYIKYTTEKFSDVSEVNWFAKTVAKLVEKGGIDGYSDGTFKPQREITQAEFIKTVVATIHGEESLATNQHWAMNYIRKAEELGYIGEGEYPETNLNNIITRYQMSKIIVGVVEAEGETFKEDRSDYINQIKDYNNIPTTYQDIVLKAFTQGLLGGYPDGEFKGTRGLTRAEASTAIVRIFDIDERLEIGEVAEGNIEVVEGINFNRDTDINTERSNPMKIDKQEEFVMLFFNSLKFYNEDGKSYLSGYVPNLPEGFDWHIDIRVHYTNDTRDSYSHDKLYERINACLYTGKNFKFELSGNKTNLSSLVVDTWILNESNGAEDGRFFMRYPDKTIERSNHIKRENIDFDWEEMIQW